MKDIKIVIGANYGDEGKGLVTRHFVREASNPIVILHNGTAQRGHTVDYGPNCRHIYHHFGSGTADNTPTFFADTFWIHPMSFTLEWKELEYKGVKVPRSFADDKCRVVTPFDMFADHATEAYIQLERGEREFGSCGLGTWCATDRFPVHSYLLKSWYKAVQGCLNNQEAYYVSLMEHSLDECLKVLKSRKVDLEKLPTYKRYFDKTDGLFKYLCNNFLRDLIFFFGHCERISFDNIYDRYNTLIFENGQGLGLDMDVDNDWHTTSHTGLVNPMALLAGRTDPQVEVCYVTRSYLTRHGVGPLEETVKKTEINATMHDLTNVPNEFQGTLRYGYLDDVAQAARIEKDWNLAAGLSNFKKTMAVTHCNEFEDLYQKANYVSYNPYSILKR